MVEDYFFRELSRLPKLFDVRRSFPFAYEMAGVKQQAELKRWKGHQCH